MTSYIVLSPTLTTIGSATSEISYIDGADWKVRFLHVTVGGHLGFHDHHFLIPIEAVQRVSEGFVTIEQSRQKVQGAPELDPNILLQPQLRREIYEYYGYPVPT